MWPLQTWRGLWGWPPTPFCQLKYTAVLCGHFQWPPPSPCSGQMPVKAQGFGPRGDRHLPPGAPSLKISGPQPLRPWRVTECRLLRTQSLFRNPGPLPAPWKVRMPCTAWLPPEGWQAGVRHPPVGSGCPASGGDGRGQGRRSFAPPVPTPSPGPSPRPAPPPATLRLLPASPPPPPEGRAKLLQ